MPESCERPEHPGVSCGNLGSTFSAYTALASDGSFPCLSFSIRVMGSNRRTYLVGPSRGPKGGIDVNGFVQAPPFTKGVARLREGADTPKGTQLTLAEQGQRPSPQFSICTSLWTKAGVPPRDPW